MNQHSGPWNFPPTVAADESLSIEIPLEPNPYGQIDASPRGYEPDRFETDADRARIWAAIEACARPK